MTHPAFLCVQLTHCLPCFIFFQSADEHLSDMEVGTDVHAGDRQERQTSVFQIVAEYVDERITDAVADSGRSARFPHWTPRITAPGVTSAVCSFSLPKTANCRCDPKVWRSRRSRASHSSSRRSWRRYSIPQSP